jgi:hypothetical protein
LLRKMLKLRSVKESAGRISNLRSVFRRADILVRHWAGWRQGGEGLEAEGGGLEKPRCVIASEAKQSRIAWQWGLLRFARNDTKGA